MSEVDDFRFEEILSKHAQAFAEAEAFSDWMPPDGEYVVVITRKRYGLMTDRKNNTEVPYWGLSGTIQADGDPELNGREFSIGFWSPRTFGMLKTAVSKLAGTPVRDLSCVSDVFARSIGAVVKVRVSTVEDDKGREFRRVTIQEMISRPAGADGREAPDAPEAG